MTQLELAAEILAGNLGMLMMHLNDFSDADMLTRPTPDANHVTWQLGHLTIAETGMVNSVKPGAGAELPPGYADKFKKDTAKLDDAKAFPTKAEVIENYSKARAASIAWVKTLSDKDLDLPTNERLRSFAPTVGHILGLMPVHTAMHIGQIQVLRRKLGKPILF